MTLGLQSPRLRDTGALVLDPSVQPSAQAALLRHCLGGHILHLSPGILATAHLAPVLTWGPQVDPSTLSGPGPVPGIDAGGAVFLWGRWLWCYCLGSHTVSGGHQGHIPGPTSFSTDGSCPYGGLGWLGAPSRSLLRLSPTRAPLPPLLLPAGSDSLWSSASLYTPGPHLLNARTPFPKFQQRPCLDIVQFYRAQCRSLQVKIQAPQAQVIGPLGIIQSCAGPSACLRPSVLCLLVRWLLVQLWVSTVPSATVPVPQALQALSLTDTVTCITSHPRGLPAPGAPGQPVMRGTGISVPVT
ncbi:Hypothetical predicted protein [Marmota monax]|uniref:Uncharacterized protein n=1 Tax=Marmota monax TaxID=9995 RepID=A0A5E4AWI5_MARMO|nr:Hypothetical predicted protein [Marmota monax]